MAEDKKKGYPKIPRANWFTLRDKFKQRPPTEVSSSYIASALNISPASASNIVSPLKALGLIDEVNKPTDLAFEWRDDATYSSACVKMLETVYPKEVRDLYHAPDVKHKDVANWFARTSRAGESAAGAFAAMYMILLEADIAKAKETAVARPKIKNVVTPKPSKTVKQNSEPEKQKKIVMHETDHGGGEIQRGGNSGFSPKLHVDIQIHISPDSTPEQIDKIFESMAKHLPLKG
jgi:hypothetical protein